MDLFARVQGAVEDRYSLERELGRGGMSVVFLARDEKHDRPVAVKVLRPEMAGSLATDRFLQEIRISAGLQHPHILQLLDSGKADDLPFCVLPYVEGETLRDRLEREQQLEIGEVVRIVEDVSDALDYAHEHHVIHRDIKPSNILLSGEHIYVGDFGVAKALSLAGEKQLTQSGFAIGTPAYMSPEQATGETKLDGRADVYSLGCMTFEMLAGEPPFSGPTAAAILAKQASQKPPSLRVVRGRVPVEMERTVERALAKVPADRFATATGFAQALATGRDLIDLPAGELIPLYRRPWTRAGAAVLALIALLAVFFWPPAPPLPPLPTPPENLLAIMFFQTPGGDETLDNFANQLTRELIREFLPIQRASGLGVLSPGAVRESMSGARPGVEIARDHNARYMVEGWVFGSGDSVVVQVSLEDSRDGQRLWQGEVRESRASAWELPLIQNVANDLADQLRRGVGATIRRDEVQLSTENREAYQALLAANTRFQRARSQIFQPLSGEVLPGLEMAEARYEAVIELDPDWIEPYLRVAEVSEFKALYLTEMQDPSDPEGALEALQVGLEAVARALREDENHPEALAKKGSLLFRIGITTSDPVEAEENLQTAEENVETAVEIDPYFAEALAVLSSIHLARGQYEDARANGERALETDAFLDQATEVKGTLAVALLNLGEEKAANTWCKELQQDSGSYVGLECELEVMAWGRWIPADPDAAALLKDSVLVLGSGERQPSFRPRVLFALAGVYGRAGMMERALEEMAEARACCPEALVLWQEAAAEVQVGDHGAAISVLERLLDQNPAKGSSVLNRDVFSPLEDHPGFRALMSKSALPNQRF